MTDLKLMAPDQPTPLERMLMEAAAKESPSAEQCLRVREALGLPTVALTPTGAPPLVGRFGGLGKLVLGGVVGATVVAALIHFGGRQPRSVLTAQQPAVLAVPTPLVTVTPPASPQQEAPPIAEITTAKPSPRAVLSSHSKAAVQAASAADLSEQLRLIESARSAVVAGNASAASQALATYASKFPRGSFGQEAQVLRIETLDLQGNHGRAVALAKGFLAQHPNSPHVSLVQRVVGAAQK